MTVNSKPFNKVENIIKDWIPEAGEIVIDRIAKYRTVIAKVGDRKDCETIFVYPCGSYCDESHYSINYNVITEMPKSKFFPERLLLDLIYPGIFAKECEK
jgi:hypothetical protein